MELFLFLDFDGTLTPLTPSPSSAVLGREARETLARLSRKPNVSIAIISGRALHDVKAKAGVPRIIYAGSHGFDIEGCGIKFSVPIPRGTKKLLSAIEKELHARFAGSFGVLIEHKGSSLTFHYRGVKPSGRQTVKRALLKYIRPYIRSGKVQLHRGKEVFEIGAPVLWHKGMAVRYLLSKCKSRAVLPVYFGDDVNDIAAFKELRKTGITVSVGKKRMPSAQMNVRSPREVLAVLKQIEQMSW